MNLRIMLYFLFLTPLLLGQAQEKPAPKPDMEIELPPLAKEPEKVATAIQIIVALTLLSLIPALLLSVTCFTRIFNVRSFPPQSFGVPNLPPNPVLIGLALFLTIFVMRPVGEEIMQNAYRPYQEQKIGSTQAFTQAVAALQKFLLRNTREKDLELMIALARLPELPEPGETPMTVLIPAFILSELRLAFQMGFLLLLPFLVIDLLVSSILLSMGMMMLPPVVIATPFKILLFVLVDGWYLLVKTLVLSYQ